MQVLWRLFITDLNDCPLPSGRLLVLLTPYSFSGLLDPRAWIGYAFFSRASSSNHNTRNTALNCMIAPPGSLGCDRS